MKTLVFLCVALSILGLAVTEKKIVCYHGTWSYYRQGNGKFGVAQIDPFLCTHLVYTFFGISSEGGIRILDPYLDLDENYGLGNIRKFNELKKVNPKLKTIAGVGGWNEGSVTFSQVVNDPRKRQNFVKNSLEFLKKYNFNGLDVDWEYPAQRGGNQEKDKEAYTLLLKELSEFLHPKGYSLSAAVASAEFSAKISYNIAEVSKYLDFIGVMTYDLHGSWDPKIGNNAPLYAGSWEQTELEKQLNVDAAIKYWLSNGGAPEKLLLGVPLYGRGFRMVNGQNKPGSVHGGPCQAGPYTQTPGMMGFNELCEKRRNEKWIDFWDDEQFVPYSTKDDQWIGFDDEKSIKFKSNYVNSHNLGGVIVWSIETDDFRGFCGRGTFPLLKELNASLLGNNHTWTPPSTSTTEWNPNLTSTTKPPPILPSPECTEDGYFRDPNDCSVFHQCINGTQYTFFCPHGLVFDPAIIACNWPHLVQC
uniref:chitinase n=1 Tax=Lutzomyia longipalpis TaxID=7200 RepID=A0A7G3ABI5_LUTLO